MTQIGTDLTARDYRPKPVFTAGILEARFCCFLRFRPAVPAEPVRLD